MNTNVIAFPGRAASATRRTTWDDLLDLTRDMMARAEANDWPVALELQTRRRQMIEAYFEQGRAGDTREVVIAGIQALLQLDQHLTDMLLQRRTQWQQELAQLRLLDRGARAYLQTSA